MELSRLETLNILLDEYHAECITSNQMHLAKKLAKFRYSVKGDLADARASGAKVVVMPSGGGSVPPAASNLRAFK